MYMYSVLCCVFAGSYEYSQQFILRIELHSTVDLTQQEVAMATVLPNVSAVDAALPQHFISYYGTLSLITQTVQYIN